MLMRTINISLPDNLAQQLDAAAAGRGFASRSEFLRDLLRKFFDGKSEDNFPLPVIVYKKKPLGEVRREMEVTGKYNKKFIDSVIRGLARSSVYAGQASK